MEQLFNLKMENTKSSKDGEISLNVNPFPTEIEVGGGATATTSLDSVHSSTDDFSGGIKVRKIIKLINSVVHVFTSLKFHLVVSFAYF